MIYLHARVTCLYARISFYLLRAPVSINTHIHTCIHTHAYNDAYTHAPWPQIIQIFCNQLTLTQNFITPTRNHCHIWQHSQTMSL